jgi:uncharacterized membrane protein
MKAFCLVFCLFFSLFILAHEGHEHGLAHSNAIQEGRPATWTQWVGSFHFIFLHFPIALINMLAVSELLFVWQGKPLFDSASRFLAISAAVLSLPTAVFGFVYSYSASYEGLIQAFLTWHMWLGILTAVMAAAVAFMRCCKDTGIFYYICLFLAVLLVNATCFAGGGMTFGPYHLHPPL